jgi:16S rRNA G1207 methylase RsmC
VERYISKEASCRFRGLILRFALSQELFSSNGIDRGTLLLLRSLSRYLDAGLEAGRPLPRRVLDAGCGVGVIGICAGRALAALEPAAVPELRICAQDRDELARVFTTYNGHKNGLAPPVLEARTAPLLGAAADMEGGWDLILSNLPAKAGKTVLADFIARSAALLNPDGRALIVVVGPLGDFIQNRIAGFALERFALAEGGEETGEYRLFLYGPAPPPPASKAAPVCLEGDFFAKYPAYFRSESGYCLEGISYRLKAVHGTPGFDNPGAAVRGAAKLAKRLRLAGLAPVLIHEPNQGHFPVWLMGCLDEQGRPPALYLAGRNILALEASRRNLAAACPAIQVRLLPAWDISAVQDSRFAFIASFPVAACTQGLIPSYWRDLNERLAGGGIALIVLPSAAAASFDRKKPKGFTRLGEVKRDGFRSLAYLKQ